MRCEDKIKYPSAQHAYGAMRKHHRRGLINIRYYHCNICGHYHLTSQPLRKKIK